MRSHPLRRIERAVRRMNHNPLSYSETTNVRRPIRNCLLLTIFFQTAAAAIVAAPTAHAAESRYQVILDPKNSYNYYYLDGSRQLLRMGISGWGPAWSWAAVVAHQKATGQEVDASNQARLGNEDLAVSLHAKRANPASLSFEYVLAAKKAVPLTMLVVTLSAFSGEGSKAVLSGMDGKETTINLPPGTAAFDSIRQITIQGTDRAGQLRFKLDPPMRVTTDREIRLVLAADVFPAGEKKTAVTVEFPADVAFAVEESALAKFAPPVVEPDWFAFKSTDRTGPGAAGMEDWLDKPAGKHGGVRMEGDGFRFADATPVKFWGTNLSYALNAPTKEDATFTAARFAKLGVNGVRMHKFTGAKSWEGIGDDNDATKMKPAGLDRLDYFCQQLGKRGVYYGWSHTFGFVVLPGNRARRVRLRRADEARRQDLCRHQLGGGRTGSADRTGRAPARAQESVHRQDLRRRSGLVVRRIAERG